MDEKAANDIAAFARSMATLRGRNAQAAANVVSKSESFTADEALKANLIEIIAIDRTQLFEKIHNKTLNLGKTKATLTTQPAPKLNQVKMTIGEKILHTLAHPNIAAILMTLGIILIYAELSAPGLGLPGIFGGIFLLIAFVSFQALPIQSGGLVLIAVGALLIGIEIFVQSGGALAFGGAAALILGLLWVVDPAGTDLRISPGIIGGIAFALFGFALVLVYGVARLRKQTAEAHNLVGGGDAAGIHGYRGKVVSAHADGKSGQVLIRGELWNFVSTTPLSENDTITVTSVNGLQLTVKKAEE